MDGGWKLGWLDCYARVKRPAPLTGEHDSLAAEKSLSVAHTTQRRIDALRITIPPLLAALRDTEPAETTEKTRWSARPGLQALSGAMFLFPPFEPPPACATAFVVTRPVMWCPL